MRVQTLQTLAGTEHDAYTQMREIANQLQKENADLKRRISLHEKNDASNSLSEQRRQELQRSNADLTVYIQALDSTQSSAGQDAHDAFSYCKVAGFEQDEQDVREEKVQQAHAAQGVLPQKNQELLNQVRLHNLNIKVRSVASDQAMQIKKPSVHHASTSNVLCSPRVSPRLLGQQVNVCDSLGSKHEV
jgi:cell division protein FtsB